MTTFDQIVREVRGHLRGYGLVRDGAAFLSAGINSSVTSFSVDDASGLAAGVIEIDRELLDVRSISSNTLTISPDGRGWEGTTAASHLINARVTANPVYPTWKIERAINDAIVGVWPDLFGVGTTTFTYNPAVSTYSIPAEAESILQVTYPAIGPSREQVEIHSYRFDSAAPTGEFATGNCLTLGEPADVGSTVTVTYAKAPSEIATGDDFTECGLRETARPAIIFSAVARLLTFVDATRTLTDSAVAAEFGSAQRVGTATQLAAQLTARYQMEVEKEKERLRKAHPAKWRWSR